MLYQGITLSLIIIEGILILISLRFLQRTNLISKDFATTCSNAKNAKEEISTLFNNLKELIILSHKRENHMLHTTFYLEEIEMYVKKILSKLEQENASIE